MKIIDIQIQNLTGRFQSFFVNINCPYVTITFNDKLHEMLREKNGGSNAVAESIQYVNRPPTRFEKLCPLIAKEYTQNIICNLLSFFFRNQCNHNKVDSTNWHTTMCLVYILQRHAGTQPCEVKRICSD